MRYSDTILIPKASLEQHGAHLPLFCDSITADEVARRAGRKAGILYTPTLWMGYSPQHLKAPGQGTGTITLRVETYLNLIYDIGRSLIHHGFRRLIFVNGHGSNVKVVDPVMRKLRNETGALIAYYKPYAERYMGMLQDAVSYTHLDVYKRQLLLLASSLAVMMLGFGVAFSLAAISLLFAALGAALGVFEVRMLSILPSRFYSVMQNEVLVAVPLFILMGTVLERSGIAEELLETAGRLFGRVRGGVAISVVLVGAVFAASTGIVGAAVVTMGMILSLIHI